MGRTLEDLMIPPKSGTLAKNPAETSHEAMQLVNGVYGCKAFDLGRVQSFCFHIGVCERQSLI